jgi:hypothetical protein
MYLVFSEFTHSFQFAYINGNSAQNGSETSNLLGGETNCNVQQDKQTTAQNNNSFMTGCCVLSKMQRVSADSSPMPNW